MRSVMTFPDLQQQGGSHGYQGLQGILTALQGGINQRQYNRLLAGYTGSNGGVDGMHGAFKGLSPYAVNFIAQNLLQKKAPNQIDTTGLSGDELFRAQLQNQLATLAPAQYELHSGVDTDFLTQLLSGGIGGHSSYAHGFNAAGSTPIGRDGPGVGALFPFHGGPDRGPRRHPGLSGPRGPRRPVSMNAMRHLRRR